MTVDVVHPLEEIDVQHRARQRRPGTFDPGPFPLERLVEDALGGQSGERVGSGELPQTPLEFEHAGAGAHPRQKLALVDRLGQEVVRSGLQTPDHLRRRRLHREKQDVDVARQVHLANPAAQRQPVHVRHFPIGDQEIGAVRLDRRRAPPGRHLPHWYGSRRVPAISTRYAAWPGRHRPEARSPDTNSWNPRSMMLSTQVRQIGGRSPLVNTSLRTVRKAG